jgi:antitoxin ParD1/3/4
MPTRNVSLTPELDRFIATKVEAGLFSNASEVMRAALRLLERDEREHDEKMAVLRSAIDRGLDSLGLSYSFGCDVDSHPVRELKDLLNEIGVGRECLSSSKIAAECKARRIHIGDEDPGTTSNPQGLL